eukprot:8116319-Pyramimonas_sp.AAC.1
MTVDGKHCESTIDFFPAVSTFGCGSAECGHGSRHYPAASQTCGPPDRHEHQGYLPPGPQGLPEDPNEAPHRPSTTTSEL